MRAISLLIVDDNKLYCTKLEACFKKINAFRLLPSAHSGEEALAQIAKKAPSLMILDMMMPGIDGMGVLTKMKERRIGRNCIVFANGSFFLDSSVMSKAQDLGVVYFFNEHARAETVYRKVITHMSAQKLIYGSIEDFPDDDCDTDEASFEKSLTNYLLGLGFRAHLAGYKFIKYAVRFGFDNYGKNLRVVQDIYPYVAKCCNTTVKCVERDIRTAIESAWRDGDLEVQYRFFGYTVDEDRGKPTNKEFLSMLTDRMVMRMNRQGE